MQLGTNRHVTDEVVEEYSMGRLAGLEMEEFEEHLLICTQCQDRLAFTDRFVGGIRSAALELRQAPAAEARPWRLSLFDLPKPAWALALAVLVIAAGIRPSLHRSNAPPAVVLLESTRGTETPDSSTPAGKPFLLVLDLTDLQPLAQYRVQIVDDAGHPVFQSSAAPDRNRLRATVARGLRGGVYYVRLYAPGQELLREYGLKVLD
jgi:hypothetical protein